MGDVAPWALDCGHVCGEDVPFRWDVHRRSTLGAVIEDEWSLPPVGYVEPDFFPWLLACCAQVVARSENADLVFIGRSPENLYDHLCGLLAGTSWARRPRLLQFSAAWGTRDMTPARVTSFRRYSATQGLDPRAIGTRSRPVALVDLVCTGKTLGVLVALLHAWAYECGVPWRAVRSRLRVVALVNRAWHSGMDRPSDGDWQETSDWVPRYLAPGTVRNIAVEHDRWCFLGNDEAKVTPSYAPPRWGTIEAARRPTEWPQREIAFRLAYGLYAYGQTRACRLEFARLLARESAMAQPWCRALVQELRLGRASH